MRILIYQKDVLFNILSLSWEKYICIIYLYHKYKLYIKYFHYKKAHVKRTVIKKYDFLKLWPKKHFDLL